ncbi:MAG: hypothetical protein ABI212_04255, partial [Burkholderiaceae bacterium]
MKPARPRHAAVVTQLVGGRDLGVVLTDAETVVLQRHKAALRVPLAETFPDAANRRVAVGSSVARIGKAVRGADVDFNFHACSFG